MDRHEAASELAKRKFFAAPVVDSENHILGIIKAERMIHGAKEDATKDIQRMFGAGGDERVFSTILVFFEKAIALACTSIWRRPFWRLPLWRCSKASLPN
jgi:magnesium transporter